MQAKKREIFAWYREALEGVDGLTLNHEPAETKNTYWMVTAVLDPMLDWPKEKLMAALDKEAIDSRPMFHPLSSLPAYAGQSQSAVARKRNAVSYRLSPWGINLPSALCLEQAQVERVAEVFRRILGKA